MIKKRHHYVPKSYLKAFCDDRGALYAYRKDDPENPTHQSPNNLAFKKHYYSQLTPEGERDNRMEDIFADIDGKWPRVARKLRREFEVDGETMGNLLTFMASQRARVPASRDFVEKMHAEIVRTTGLFLDAKGKLPPKPTGHENILETMNVHIDPHRSLITMPQVMDATLDVVFSKIGMLAFRNKTDIPFLTSDNPVIWLDPTVLYEEMRPYTLQQGGAVLFIFPVSPDYVIYGDSAMRGLSEECGFFYANMVNPESVEKINDIISRFAYNWVFSQKTGQEGVIRKYADLSPILKVTRLPGRKGIQTIFSTVFGPRTRKPKWKEEFGHPPAP